jgi:hypothetical protein
MELCDFFLFQNVQKDGVKCLFQNFICNFWSIIIFKNLYSQLHLFIFIFLVSKIEQIVKSHNLRIHV